VTNINQITVILAKQMKISYSRRKLDWRFGRSAQCDVCCSVGGSDTKCGILSLVLNHCLLFSEIDNISAITESKIPNWCEPECRLRLLTSAILVIRFSMIKVVFWMCSCSINISAVSIIAWLLDHNITVVQVVIICLNFVCNVLFCEPQAYTKRILWGESL